MLRAVSGVAGCWLYRGMTSLEPPTELCTGALTSAPPHLPHPANSPPNTQTTYFQALQPPAKQPCCLLNPGYCAQPHSKADARQISLCVGIWVWAKNETVARGFFKAQTEPN